MHTITVSPEANASGAFHSLQAAIESIPANNTSRVTIRLMPGVYHEKVVLEKPFVTLLGTGDSPCDTVISYSDYGYEKMPDGGKRGTFRSYTLFVHANDVTLQNLTVENASGDSMTHGQAIALYAECDRFIADSCRFLGHQDTLFTGPLPPREYEPGGFTGPTQFAPRINGRHYYRNCYICGDIDFIFGSATAYFEHCTLESLRRTPIAHRSDTSGCEDTSPAGRCTPATEGATEGYVTAASTPEGQEYGYVFCKCSFLSRDCPPSSVYLGRPWRDFAKVVLICCSLGAHIHPAGFHDWGKVQSHETVFFAEYKDTPSPNRADFVQTLSPSQATHFSREKVLSPPDGWEPWQIF